MEDAVEYYTNTGPEMAYRCSLNSLFRFSSAVVCYKGVDKYIPNKGRFINERKKNANYRWKRSVLSKKMSLMYGMITCINKA